MLIQLIPYQQNKYIDYLEFLRKKCSSSEILREYMIISQKIKNLLPPNVEIKLKNFENRYYLYLYFEDSSLKKLYSSYSSLVESLSPQFINLSLDSGFIDTKRKNLVLVLGYYEKSA